MHNKKRNKEVPIPEPDITVYLRTNSVTINLDGDFTPNYLREVADFAEKRLKETKRHFGR